MTYVHTVFMLVFILALLYTYAYYMGIMQWIEDYVVYVESR